MEFHLYVSPVAKIPANRPVSTSNPAIVQNFKTGSPDGAGGGGGGGDLATRNAELEAEVKTLKAKLAEAEAEIARLKGDSSFTASKIAGAQGADAALNG